MLANPPGGASGIPAHTFFAGSAPTVITTVVRFQSPVFHVPHTFDGACALALFAGSDCQSPPRAFGSAVTSVMNSAGKIGRPNGSVPFSRLPTVGRHPTCGDVRQPGVPGYGDTVPAHPLCVTPSDSACSSLYHSRIASFTDTAHCPAVGLKVRSTVLSLNTVAVREPAGPDGYPRLHTQLKLPTVAVAVAETFAVPAVPDAVATLVRDVVSVNVWAQLLLAVGASGPQSHTLTSSPVNPGVPLSSTSVPAAVKKSPVFVTTYL